MISYDLRDTADTGCPPRLGASALSLGPACPLLRAARPGAYLGDNLFACTWHAHRCAQHARAPSRDLRARRCATWRRGSGRRPRMPRWPRRSAGPLTPGTALQVCTSSLCLICFLLTHRMMKPVFSQTGHVHCVPDANTAVDHAIHVFLLESLNRPLHSLSPHRSEHISTAPTMFASHPGGPSLMVSSGVKVTMREVVGAVHTA